MNPKIIIGLLIILVIGALGQPVVALLNASNQQPATGSSAGNQGIRGATVLIQMQMRVTKDKTHYFLVTARAMGSIVQIGDQTVLITHNHWAEVLNDLAAVEIRDANDQLLKSESGRQFTNQIRYQDNGTLILNASSELTKSITPGILGNINDVKPGSIVQVAYRQPPARSSAGVQSAVVEAIHDNDGIQTYQLRSLSGEPILPGDSGGGIWLDGKYVGNMWTTMMVETVQVPVTSNGKDIPFNYKATDESTAAAFPLHALERDNNGNEILVSIDYKQTTNLTAK